MAILLTDDFNRADSTNVIGSPTTGGPYTVRGGTWGINSNQAYTSVSSANAHVTFPAAVDVDLQAEFPVNAINAALIFRWIDTSNFWMLVNDASRWALARITGGAGVTYSRPIIATAANGDVVRLVAKGKFLYGFVNGVLRVQCEDPFLGVATATCGYRLHSTTTARIDNVTANDAPALIPGGIDGTAAEVASSAPLGSDLQNAALLYKGRNTATEDQMPGAA